MIDYIKPSLQNRLKYYSFIDDLSKGWAGIVDKKDTYLPKTKSETDTKYKARHDLATYFDYFNPTIDGINGLIFKNPIQLNDDVPEQLQDDLRNANTLGDSFQTVAGRLFDNAIRKGLMFALVDLPKAEVNNRADEIALGVRPYITLIEPENVTSWKTAVINGNTVLTQVKIREFVDVDDEKNPFATVTVEQYRVLHIGRYELYDSKGNLIDMCETGWDRIHLHCLNLDDIGFFEAEPPLYELGKLNIAHYQIFCDSRYSAHTASIPFYHASGVHSEEMKGIVIEPNTMATTSDPQSKISIVDYDGKGVSVNRDLMSDIVARINEIGFSVVMEDKQQTATESMLNGQQKQSKLNRWVGNLKDTLEKILESFALIGGYKQGGTVEIDADILTKPLTAQEVTALNNMVTSGNLSIESAWKMIEQGSIKLPDDFDPELEKERLNETGLLSEQPTI